MKNTLNLSSGLERTGRAAVCIWHGGAGAVLMVAAESADHAGRWTLPGGRVEQDGVEQSETPEQAAVRGAWEESGARVKLEGGGFGVISARSGTASSMVLARLLHLKASPERRLRRWINPLEWPWAEDYQLKAAVQMMRAREYL